MVCSLTKMSLTGKSRRLALLRRGRLGFPRRPAAALCEGTGADSRPSGRGEAEDIRERAVAAISLQPDLRDPAVGGDPPLGASSFIHLLEDPSRHAAALRRSLRKSWS